MKKRLAPLKNNKGLTLIEVVVSLGILGLILAPTLALFGGSLTNTKFTQESIENKYLAEKYMEIVKAVPVSGLEAALGDEFNKTGSAYVNAGEGVTITLEESEYRTADVINSYLFNEGSEIYINSAQDIFIRATMSGTEITLIEENGVNIFKDNVGLEISEYKFNAYTEPYLFKVLLNPSSMPTGNNNTISITNVTGRKLEFYCVNENPGGGYHDNRTLPQFVIKEGQVSYHDFTVTPENERLADEDEDLFTSNDKKLTLAYTVTIVVANEKGRYEIESVKAIYK